jgi:hypothetical protein
VQDGNAGSLPRSPCAWPPIGALFGRGASRQEASGNLHGGNGHADRLRHSSRGRRNAHHADLRSLIEWVGVDRLLFSSDYPHWDFDDPRFAFKTPLTETECRKIFSGNARALYKL